MVLGDARFGLRDLRLHESVVEAEENVVLVDEVALLEEDLDDLAIDAGLDGDVGERLDRAGRRQNDWHVRGHDRGRGYGSGRSPALALSLLGGRFGGRG